MSEGQSMSSRERWQKMKNVIIYCACALLIDQTDLTYEFCFKKRQINLLFKNANLHTVFVVV